MGVIKMTLLPDIAQHLLIRDLTPTSLQSGLGARTIPTRTPAAPEAAMEPKDDPEPESEDEEEGAAATDPRTNKNNITMVLLETE